MSEAAAVLANAPGGLAAFRRDLADFRRLAAAGGRFALDPDDVFPCLDDATPTTGFDRHYVYHPAWAARVLTETQPARHVDISSTLHFCSIVSAFLPVDFYDYRPADLRLTGLGTGTADLTALPFASGSIESLSCMHTLEHIGLGRYGDPLDPDADLKAMAELRRVLAPGGTLLVVVPVGRPRIVFNAHRIYAHEQIVEAFPDLVLREFSLVPDDPAAGGLISGADPVLVAKQSYACGCFRFERPQRSAAPRPVAPARRAPINVTIFSKDRGCQLELLLRSMRSWVEAPEAVVNVLYTYSDDELARGYELTKALHPWVRYTCERETGRSFRDATLGLLDPEQPLTVFFVDDDVFRAPFTLEHPAVERLLGEPELACLSLRLCERIDYTYATDRDTPPPPLVDGVWRWREGDGDWGYPMSLDGHIFRTRELLALLRTVDFFNPNSLEAALAERPLPGELGICLADSVVVNLPANRVQDTAPNRHGDIPAELLNGRFLAGERIRLEPIAAVANTSVHSELDLLWEPRPTADVDGRATALVRTLGASRLVLVDPEPEAVAAIAPELIEGAVVACACPGESADVVARALRDVLHCVEALVVAVPRAELGPEELGALLGTAGFEHGKVAPTGVAEDPERSVVAVLFPDAARCARGLD